MECYYHEGREAVGKCVDCGKTLCRECFDLWDNHMCDACNAKRAAVEGTAAQRDLRIMAVLGILVLIWAVYTLIATDSGNHIGNLITGPLSLAGIYAGWKALTVLTDGFFKKFFVFMPMIGWLIYIIIKIIVALVIGWMFIPYRIYKDIKTQKAVKAVQIQIAAREAERRI